jgi:hypothetical protein
MAESGADISVVTFDPTVPAPAAAGIDVFFLRGLGYPEAANASLRAADDALRAVLDAAEIAYQVIYGNDEESLEQITRVLHAIGKAVGPEPVTVVLSDQKPRDPDVSAPWVWLCDKCSDPLCEHRLLTDLLRQRQQPNIA